MRGGSFWVSLNPSSRKRRGKRLGLGSDLAVTGLLARAKLAGCSTGRPATRWKSPEQANAPVVEFVTAEACQRRRQQDGLRRQQGHHGGRKPGAAVEIPREITTPKPALSGAKLTSIRA